MWNEAARSRGLAQEGLPAGSRERLIEILRHMKRNLAAVEAAGEADPAADGDGVEPELHAATASASAAAPATSRSERWFIRIDSFSDGLTDDLARACDRAGRRIAAASDPEDERPRLTSKVGSGDREDQEEPDGHRRQRIVDRLTTQLQLSPDQQKKVETILEDGHKRITAIYRQSQDQARPQYDAVHTEIRTRIRAVLTPAQQPKFDDFLKRLDAERKAREQQPPRPPR